MKELSIPGILAVLAVAPAAAEVSYGNQLSCLLEPSQTVSLRSAVSGLVKQVNTERGDAVKKNQTLIALENTLEKVALETSKARVAFAQRKVERNQAMKNMVSEYERDELLTEQKLAELSMREAQEKLRKRTITSPIDGMVVKRDISVGEFVDDQPLMELVALDPLYAEVVMRVDDYGLIEKDMEVSVEVEKYEDESLPGKVKIVDRVIDGASGTFGVRIELPNPDNRIPAGLKCRIAFEPER